MSFKIQRSWDVPFLQYPAAAEYLPTLPLRLLSLLTLRSPRVSAFRTARVVNISARVDSGACQTESPRLRALRTGRTPSLPLLKLTFPTLIVCHRKQEPRQQARKAGGTG